MRNTQIAPVYPAVPLVNTLIKLLNVLISAQISMFID
jgi:hypothetical protein